MKIAFACPDFYPHIGGVETVVLQLASNLAALGHEVTVLTQSNDGLLSKKESIHGFKILRFNTAGFGELRISFGLLNYLWENSNKFDLIHIHNYHSFPALAVAVTKKVPIIFSPHYHGTGHSLLTRIIHLPYRLLGRYIFSKSDAVIGDTDAETELIKKHFPDIKKITILPPAIDVLGIQKAPKLTKKSKYILSVGRLESYKNAEVIIRSLQFIDSEINLLLVGEGPLLRQLEDLTRQLSFSGRVSFLGNISEVKLFSLFKSAQVFVTMSSMEAYGLSLLEAAAAEIGIVASKIPSHTELVNKFEIKNVSLLSLSSSSEDVGKSVRAAMLKPAEVGKKLPSWKDVTEQTLNIYKKYV